MRKILVNISLRIWHPTLQADAIAARLGLTPKFAYNVGQRRKMPNGRLLEGNYEQSYVSMPLVRKIEVELDEELMRWCTILEQHVEFLYELKNTGGELTFSISMFPTGLSSFYLDNHSLQRVQSIGLGVDVDIYPEEDTGK
jgi:hypothetical protein